MRKFLSVRSAIFIAAALAGVSAPALAAEVWISCDGSVVTKPVKGEATTTTASDVYVYNDDTKLVYRYLPNQTLSIMPITGYSDKQFTWANNSQSGEVSWNGTIDRAALTLKQTRDDDGEIMTWTQQCKPASAQPVK